jgi:hypothetical protein
MDTVVHLDNTLKLALRPVKEVTCPRQRWVRFFVR